MTDPAFTEYPPEELPAHDLLADDRDQLGWDINEHGRMREFSTADDTVPTVSVEV